MAEYDAFGRRMGEDDPAVTPSDASPTPRVESNAVRSAALSEASARAPGPPRPTGLMLSGRPSRSFGGLWIGIVITIAIGAGGAIIAITATSSVDGTIRRYLPTFPAVTVAPEAPAPTTATEPAQPPPEGLGTRSLVRHERFAPALVKLRHGLGRLTNLRLAPERIVVQLVTKRGQLRNVQIGVGGDLREVSLSGPGFGSVPTMPFSQIDSRAPERLVREAARRGRFSATQIDYLVVTRGFRGGLAWYAYFKNNRRYEGDGAGRVVRRF